MKCIDIENWARKKHYSFFKGLDYPHFNICANLTITPFYDFIKSNHLSFFKTFIYLTSKTANDIKEFRYRIRKDLVVEHEITHPSFTVMTSQEVFNFCTAPYIENLADFIKSTTTNIALAHTTVNLEDEPERDDLVYMTSIPWVSFTSITHPIHMNPTDSIPRIAWGKYFKEDENLKIPLSVQVHHALADGAHVGQYFTLIQDYLNRPTEFLQL
jgi:chloramphenicol O-acetyltransferase type A